YAIEPFIVEKQGLNFKCIIGEQNVPNQWVLLVSLLAAMSQEAVFSKAEAESIREGRAQEKQHQFHTGVSFHGCDLLGSVGLQGLLSSELKQISPLSKFLKEFNEKSICYVINAVNKIKSNALNNRLFHKLCEENDEEFERLLLHTKGRWLSKGKRLRRFHELFDTVVEFLESIDPTYLTDVFDKLNEVNQLKEDMETRFYDLINLEVLTLVLNPFTADFAQPHPKLQEPLTDLKYDCEAQSHFQSYGYEAFWVKMRNTYPILWEEVKLLLLAFPSTYLVERGFSAVQQILSKSRNMLNITECGDLSMRLTKMVPDIKKLASAHQAQGSH
ncbi:hypothetical protein L345_01043, partial [Ophiophagus hannah]